MDKNHRNWAERVKNHICMDGDVETTLDMLAEGIRDSAAKKRFGAMAQLLKIKLELGAKIHEIDTRALVDSQDKNHNVNITWAQPKREIQ
jgi:hypothetical protein